MDREVRHPYQILNVDELIVGQNYTFATGYRSGEFMNGFRGIFCGMINGYRDTNPDARPETFINQSVLDSIDSECCLVTIHMNGWTRYSPADDNDPILVYWGPDGWDKLDTYIGSQASGGCISIVVPHNHWENDSQIYLNPIERHPDMCKNTASAPDDWEVKIKSKRDAAMAKMFGF